MGDLSFIYLGTQVAFPSPVGFKPWNKAIGRPLAGTLGRRWTLIIQAPVINKTVDRQGKGIPVADSPPIEPDHLTDLSRDSVRPQPVVLEVRDLRKSFRSGFLKRRIRGVEGVSFSVNRGSVFALIGHNGAGKTTIINCILDLVHADGGEVSIMGVDHRDPASRIRVGYLPERPYFFEHLSGRELLQFYAQLLGMPKNRRASRIDEVLEMVGMTEFAGRRLKKFSKGMLQRMGLAQAVLGEPELLILDEPMSGLDPMGRREIRELLMKLKQAGTTIILSSHIVPDVEMIADTVGILKEGCLVAVQDLAEWNHDFSYTGELDLGGQRARVGGDGVADLRKLLNDCHRDAIPVLSLETRRTSLEELFMEINGGASVKREVVR
jgi:ABC-2 type transport system ATP-binding protein